MTFTIPKSAIFIFLFLLGALPSAQAYSQRILLIGDSLTAGYGVERDAAYPSLLEKRLKKERKDLIIVNAGTSGATSAFALKMFNFHTARQTPEYLVLALGANDALRGLDIKTTKKNLATVIELAQTKKIKVVLVGLKAPPNYGTTYFKQFEKIFPELAQTYAIPLVPFLLEGVAGEKEYNQPDGIHPNEKGHQIMADHVYQVLKKVL
jgi:acyl-CoA thioesterase-1